MEALLPEDVKTVVVGLMGLGVFVVWLARTFPQVAWLEPFQLRSFQPTEAQRARHRSFGNIKVGVELILAGIALPMLYLLSRIFMFNEPTVTGMLVSGGLGLLAIMAGITVLVRYR